MQEYISDAIVLAKKPAHGLDTRYSIFTKRFGKMVARATSARKITSKLAGHLEPGTFARVRLIETHGLQVVDALKNSFGAQKTSFTDLSFLDRLLAEGEPEPFIWSLIERGQFDWEKALTALGWSPEEASCSICNRNPVVAFLPMRQDFFCARCITKLPVKLRRDAISLRNALQSERTVDEQGGRTAA